MLYLSWLLVGICPLFLVNEADALIAFFSVVWAASMEVVEENPVLRKSVMSLLYAENGRSSPVQSTYIWPSIFGPQLILPFASYSPLVPWPYTFCISGVLRGVSNMMF